MKHVERFLEEGSKVKLTIMFRGREMAHPELGRRILERVAEQVAELAIVESAPKQDGRNMTMVLNPTRRPKGKGQGATQGCTEVRRRRQRRRGRPTGPRSPRPHRPTRASGRSHRRRHRLTEPIRNITMPKMKTHRGAAKRFKMTGTGKIRAPQGVPGPPAREEVVTRRTRRLGRLAEVTGGDTQARQAPARER